LREDSDPLAQVLGVRRRGAALVCFAFFCRLKIIAVGQSGVRPPHSKELSFPDLILFLISLNKGLNMRSRSILFLLVVVCLGVMVPARAQEQAKPKPEPQAAAKPGPANKLIEFHMALLKHGPKWTATESPETARMHQQHVAYVMSLLNSGKAILAGPFTDGGEIDGVFVFRAKTAAEAKAWAEADPSVAAGFRTAEMHPWWSEDIFKNPAAPMKLTPMYLCFLTRGDKWTPEKTAATQAIQDGHMANIGRLAEMKKLIAAGPFGDDGRLRGIFVFRVASLEEAKTLTETDPAVKAGRLALEIHPWLVPEGVLP
jgi:uncharacterized protein YciI